MGERGICVCSLTQRLNEFPGVHQLDTRDKSTVGDHSIARYQDLMLPLKVAGIPEA